MSQQDMSCWAPVLDAPQRHDEAQQLTEVTEALDSLERSWNGNGHAGLKAPNCNPLTKIPLRQTP
jgi:hypothetical protein